MGFLDTFRAMDEASPFEHVKEDMYQSPNQAVPEFDKPANDPHVWLDRYAQFSARPKFNQNIDGYISPYASGHWGASSDIMQSIAAGMELGPMQEKVDPNKIFTSDIAALRTLAADQIKIIRVFERKFLESLNDKGKFGLNEDDIEALQALTSARSALTAINKEQIAVKKNIAELKIKQQQANGSSAPGGTQQTSGRSANAYDIGRSIMDNLWDMTPAQTSPPVQVSYPAIDPSQASDVLDQVVDVGQLASSVQYEADSPTTYVLVGDSDDDVEFATYSKNGELMDESINPTSKITSIDRSTDTAMDEFLVTYPIRYKSDM